MMLTEEYLNELLARGDLADEVHLPGDLYREIFREIFRLRTVTEAVEKWCAEDPCDSYSKPLHDALKSWKESK